MMELTYSVALDLQPETAYCRFNSHSNETMSKSFTCVSVTKQCDLVPA